MQPLSAESLALILGDVLVMMRGSAAPEDALELLMALLVLKRLSDEPRVLPAFQKTASTPWSGLLRAGWDIAPALNAVCAAMDHENPGTLLWGSLGEVDFGAVARGDSSRKRDDVLVRVLRTLNGVDLCDKGLQGPEALGEACDTLIERWAEQVRASHASYTPQVVAKLMSALLEPENGMSICDPVCGTGTTLAMVCRYVSKHEKLPAAALKLELAGQEWNPRAWRMCRMNLFLHGIEDAAIELGNVLREPRLLQPGAGLKLFDRVIADPPFSLKDWGAEEAERDPFLRYRFGIPPRDQGDYAFIQHCWSTLKRPNGKAVVLVLPGVLFRGGADGRIRRAMLEADAFEAVISLKPNLFHDTALAPALLILSRSKPAHQRGKILLIEASRESGSEGARGAILPEEIEHILDRYHDWADEPGFARVLSEEEARQVDFDLHPARHVRHEERPQLPDLRQVLNKLQLAQAERTDAYGRMDALIADLRKR